jgi:hypothetical protein
MTENIHTAMLLAMLSANEKLPVFNTEYGMLLFQYK